MKKGMALILAAMMGVSLVGCQGKEVTQNKIEGSDQPTADTTKPQEAPNENPLLASEKPLDLSFHMHFRNSYAYKEDWPVYKKAAELTNITLKGVAPSSATSSQEVFNLMMVAGDLPDIVGGNNLKNDFLKYGPEEAFIPLNDLIEEHAPHIKKFLEEHPYVKQFASAPDGNMYFLPYIPEGNVSKGYFIRKDWLDKLGLSVPTNVDELYNVLKAFREQDPNGNGVKDEIPFFSRHVGENFYDNELLRLTHFWGGRTNWYADENGKVKFGYATDEFKTGITEVTKWYKEGLIDPEIFTRGGKSRDIVLANNTGGMTHDWFASTAAYNDSLAGEIPGFEFIPIAPPADVYGKVWEESSRELVKPDGWAITSANKHAVETIKYFDFWFTEEGRRLANFGIEGEQYDMIDGKPIFKEEVLKGEKSVQAQLWDIGAQIPIGFFQDYTYESQTFNDLANLGVDMYVNNGYVIDAFPEVTLTEEEQKVYNDKWVNIETYMTESHQKWVLGAEKVEDGWGAYINRLNDLGLSEITAIYQKAYDRLK